MAESVKNIGGDWVEKKDPTTERVYYANVKTKESSWTFPDDLAHLPLPDGWIEQEDPNTQRKYYSNPKTRETSWVRPTVDVGASAAAPAPAPEKKEPKMFGDWEEKDDPNTGRSYYYNMKTEETSWTKPDLTKAADPTPQEETASSDATKEDSTEENGSNVEASASAEPAPSAKPKLQKQNSSDNKFDTLRKLAAEKRDEAATANIQLPDESRISTTDELAKEMDSLRLEKYAEEHFKLNRKGAFGGKTTMDKILSWKKDQIKTPLRQLNPELSSEAVQVFKNVMSFMGDRVSKTKKDPVEHALKILKNTLHAPEDLRDEVFCQVCKQTRGNPSDENTKKGFQLCLILLSAYPPSHTFSPFLEFYLKESAAKYEGNAAGIGTWALLCQEMFPKSALLGPRFEVPPAQEIQSVMENHQTALKVFFLNGTFKTLLANSWTTAAELKNQMCKKAQTKDMRPFALYEISSDDEEQVLEDTVRIMDLMANWEKTQREEKQRKGKNAQIKTFRFVFKVRLFLEPEETDVPANEIFYIQAVHDVVSARYPVTKEDNISLAALQCQKEMGNFTNDVAIKDKLEVYIQQKHLHKKAAKNAELIASVCELWGGLNDMASHEAQLSYMELVRAWKVYGSTFFVVEPKSQPGLPNYGILAVTANGILIIDMKSRDIVQEFTYDKVVTWGCTDKSFVLHYGTLEKKEKLFFLTDQGKEIIFMVSSYVGSLVKD